MSCTALIRTEVVTTEEDGPIIQSRIAVFKPTSTNLSSGFVLNVIAIQRDNITINITNTLDTSINKTIRLFLGNNNRVSILATLPGPIVARLTVVLSDIEVRMSACNNSCCCECNNACCDNNCCNSNNCCNYNRR